MSLRAKFRVGNISHDASSRYDSATGKSVPCVNETVALHAVYEDNGPNKQWSAATPCGYVSMTISEEGAQGYFKLGQEYFLDFTPAE